MYGMAWHSSVYIVNISAQDMSAVTKCDEYMLEYHDSVIIHLYETLTQ